MNTIRKISGKLHIIWKDTETPSIIEWLVWGGLCIFSLFSFIYGDVITTSWFSVECIENLLNGNLLNFYQITLDQTNPFLIDPAVYDLPIYLVLGILEIPLLIYSRIYGIENMALNSPGCLVWIKLILVLFVTGTAVIIYEICKEMGVSKKTSRWVSWIFLTSIHLFVPAVVLSQYDIISVFFMMLGWLLYLKDKKTGFYLCFALAITLKLFALFVFVPLVLLNEKRVLHIIIKLLKGCALLIFFRLLFYHNVGYEIATGSFMEDMLQKFSATSFGNVGLISVSVFAVVYFCVCIVAYTIKVSDKLEISNWFYYLSFIVFGTFALFCVINPYWALLYVPFSVLMLFINTDKFKVNLYLEMFMALGLQICLIKPSPWVYSNGIVASTYFAQWVSNENPRYGAVADLLDRSGISAFLPVIAGMTVACFLGMVFINVPKKNLQINSSLIRIERSTMWLRFTFALLTPALVLYVYIIPEKVCVLDTGGGICLRTIITYVKQKQSKKLVLI